MAVYTRVIHTGESLEYLLHPDVDSDGTTNDPVLHWCGRASALLLGAAANEPAGTKAVAGLLDDFLDPSAPTTDTGGRGVVKVYIFSCCRILVVGIVSNDHNRRNVVHLPHFDHLDDGVRQRRLPNGQSVGRHT